MGNRTHDFEFNITHAFSLKYYAYIKLYTSVMLSNINGV